MLFGCGAPSPAATEARKVVERHLEQFGEITDFRKTNGLEGNVSGFKVYRLIFRAAVRMGPGFHAIRVGGRLQEIRRDEAGFLEEGTSLPEGTLYVAEGEVLFQASEKGWIYDSWRRGKFGYCTTQQTPADCYRFLKWD